LGFACSGHNHLLRVTPGLQGNRAPVGSNPGGWLTGWRFAALLGLLLIATFPKIVAGWGAFFRLDAARFGYPVAFYHREAFWRAQIPLWNPLNSCGVPFLAQWNTMTLYPLSLFYLLLPMPWSFGMFELGHVLLAGIGMYFLALRWAGTRAGAAWAGAVFAFNGFTWQALMWPNIIAAWGWMPWVVLLAERGWREGGRWVWVASLAGAMQMLSGGAEVILLTWLVLGVLWAALLLGTSERCLALGRDASPRRPFRALADASARRPYPAEDSVQIHLSRWWIAARAAGIACLVAALSAAQLLPFLDLLAHSQRSVNYADAGDVVMPAWGWANYLVPLFHGFRTAQGIFLQPTQNWTASYYVGIGTVGLALLAFWRARNLRVWLLAGLTFFGLLMALGSQAYLYDVVRRIVPPLGLLRFPIKFVMLATFALPLLAACGLGWLESLPDKAWARERWKPVALALGLLGAIALILCFAWKRPLEGDLPSATVRNGLLRAAFLVVTGGAVALVGTPRRGVRASQNTDASARRPYQPEGFRLTLRRVAEIGLPVLLWLDISTHTPNLSPTAPAAALAPDTIRQYFGWDDQFLPGTTRALQSPASHWKMTTRLAGDPQTDLYGRRLSLFADLNLLDHAAKFDGFYPLDLKEFADIFNLVYFTTNQTARLRDFAAVSLTGNPTNAVDWVRRDTWLPIIMAGQKPLFADNAGTLAAIGSARFDPRHEVYLPREAEGRIHATEATSARVVSSQFSAQRVSLTVEAAAPAMVSVAQAFYHPWHAYVDGKPTPLWRANYAFQALEVPTGRHEVRLAYEDRAFVAGCIISLGCLLGVVLLARVLNAGRDASPRRPSGVGGGRLSEASPPCGLSREGEKPTGVQPQ
ncbi:MAG TPA: YfhO family protein, partial [Candidatus Acidoferrum sp.]|nr:YfhO family protein [Candidatus Acidoferrum sp.]